MTDVSQIIVTGMKDLAPAPDAQNALATVTASDSTGVLVRFDGETAASTRRYRTVGGCRTGDRVLMTRAGSTWVAVGAVGTRSDVPIARYEGSAALLTWLPNDAIVRTTHLAQSVATVPAGALTALVSMSVEAGAATNAAAQWTPLWSTNNGVSSWENLLNDRISHNNAEPNNGNGFAVTAAFDVRNIAVGQACAVAVNGWAHTAGAGVTPGNLIYSITFMGTAP